jgi:signal transduction histidine kinase
MRLTAGICLLFLNLIFSHAAWAQPLVVAGGTSSAFDRNIIGEIWYATDSTGLQIYDVAALPDSCWESNAGSFTFYRPNSPATYWLSFRVAKMSGDTGSYFLQLSNRGINEAELFVLKQERLLALGKTGDKYSFSQRPYPSVNFTFPLLIESGDTLTCFLHCDKRNENLNLKLRLLDADALKNQESRGQLYLGLFCGVLIMAFLISLMMLAIFRNRLNFWYSIYILLIINMLLTYEGIDFKWFYPDHPFYAGISRYVASTLSLAAMMQVMQLFCKQRPENSRFYFLVNYLKYLVLLTLPATWIIYSYFPELTLKKAHFQIFLAEQLFGISLVMASCLEKIVQRYRPAIFYFSAVGLLLYSSINSILLELGKINRNADTPNLLQWSFILEVVLISIGILYKYQLVIRQNRALHTELADLKLTSARGLIEIQQKEQSRIAEDLHDLLGAQLATLKFKIMGLPVAAERKEEALRMINDLSKSSREIAHDLRPAILHQNDLSDIAAMHLRQLNREQDQIQFDFIQLGTPRPFTNEQEMNLYKIFMELVANILRHSSATEATVQFSFYESEFQLIAEDNGKGLTPGKRDGMGIHTMQKRVHQMCGQMHIDTAPGNTTFIITFPYSP